MPSLLTLTDVMGTGHHAARAAKVQPGKIVAVVGDGAVGLCGVIAARRLGAERIIMLGRHRDRIALARAFGATARADQASDLGSLRGRSPSRNLGHADGKNLRAAEIATGGLATAGDGGTGAAQEHGPRHRARHLRVRRPGGDGRRSPAAARPLRCRADGAGRDTDTDERAVDQGAGRREARRADHRPAHHGARAAGRRWAHRPAAGATSARAIACSGGTRG